MKSNILLLKDIDKESLDTVGAKAFFLSKLIRKGFHVPAGFVITPQCFHQDKKELRKLIETFCNKLEGDLFAVRSSATCEDGKEQSFAGQFDTFLNVPQKDVWNAIVKCCDSLHGKKAQSYRQGKNGQMAVIVQEMVQSDVSGTGFSVHPVTKDLDEMIVESIVGLGEDLVSGRVTPNTYILKKTSLETKTQKNVSFELSPKTLKEIGKLLKDVEHSLGFPVDIEWGQKDNKLFLLQARPITTLQNPKNQLLLGEDWQHFLTRPFDLFGASLWQAWYDSPEAQQVLGVRIPNALMLEQQRGIVRYYFLKEDRRSLTNNVLSLVQRSEEDVNRFLEKGESLNQQALKYIEKKEPLSLEESISFMISLALHATVFPNIALKHMSDLGLYEGGAQWLAQKLRGKSHYPDFIQQVITPLAVQRLVDLGVQNAHEVLKFITIKELLAEDIEGANLRIQQHKARLLFVYQVYEGKESIQWNQENESLMDMIEDGVVDVGEGNVLQGEVAFEGKVRGIARVVLYEDVDVLFNEGDILVSIHSTPTLMPLIKKCGGIVTDEGGVSCHAAIVSRECKKPCVMSTKNATRVIKDGDFIEVDAYKGVVRIIKYA